jgi:hypothetical protein
VELNEDHVGKNLKPGKYGEKRSVRYERYEFNAEAQRAQEKEGGQENIKKNLCDLCASALIDLFAVRFIKIMNKIVSAQYVRVNMKNI